MSKTIAQVTLFRKGGLPEDQVVNTMHFEDDTPAGDGTITTNSGISENGPGLVNRIAAFYAGIGTTWLSPVLSGQGRINLYRFEDAIPRIPRLVHNFTFPVGGNALPSEVAVCISFKAAPVPGAVAARRRGRIFLGPLSAGISAQAGSEPDARLDNGLMNGLLTSFKPVAVSATTTGAYRLAIYSPTSQASGVSADDSWNDVATLYMDNAFDTIRKRGAKATLRRNLDLASGPTY